MRHLAAALLVSAALAGCGGGAGNADADATAITALAVEWYRDADPAVCDRMTDALLEFGWEASGDAGRRACRDALGQADPVADVTVAAPRVEGDGAETTVTYTLRGAVQSDHLRFVRGASGWLVDAVRRAG